MRKINKEKVKEKTRVFWKIIGTTQLRARITKESATVLWTEGNVADIDFWNDIYYVDVHKDDLNMFKRWLRVNKIIYITGEINEELKEKIKRRPLIVLTSIEEFSSEIKRGFPIMPLKEFIQWCKGKQPLEHMLEYADMRFNLGLGIRCSDCTDEVKAIMEKHITREKNKEKRKAERLVRILKHSNEFNRGQNLKV